MVIMGEFSGRAGQRSRRLRRRGCPARRTAAAPAGNSPILSSRHALQSLPRQRGVETLEAAKPALDSGQ